MRSSTEAWLGAARDTGHLVAFRARTVRRRRASAIGLAVVLVLTLTFAVAPNGLDLEALGSPTVERALASVRGNLGAAFAGFLLLAISSAMGSGGGRELLSRSEAAVHPISPLTEHLGALLLAPVNLAWLVQVWGLLAVTALVAPSGGLAGAQVVVLAWVLAQGRTVIAIPSARKVEHVEDSARAADLELSAADLEAITKAEFSRA